MPLRPAVGMRSRARTARADRLCAAAVRVRSRVASQTTRALLGVSTNTALAAKLASQCRRNRSVSSPARPGRIARKDFDVASVPLGASIGVALLRPTKSAKAAECLAKSFLAQVHQLVAEIGAFLSL